MTKHKTKAIALLSGGLDSALAIKLVQEQGIEVIGINLTSPFFSRSKEGKSYAQSVADKLGITFRTINLGMEYLKVIRSPKYGLGSAINPCIDCKIFMFKKAKKLMQELKADFIVTGEVLNQRPMSQHYQALQNIEKEAGLKGKLLRPLSARHLPETEAENKGWVNREKLLAIKGRERKIQFALAKRFGIEEYSSPAGGCLLTHKEFSKKLKDLLENKKKITLNDILLLKAGRHFRFEKNKIIVGRNEAENHEIIARKEKSDLLFEVPDCGSPTTLLQGAKDKKAIEIAARLTAKYCDLKDEKITVNYGKDKFVKSINVEPSTQEEADRLNLTKSMGR